MSVLQQARATRATSGPAVAGIVAGSAGAVLALAQLVIPPEVPAGRFSYPLAPAQFTTVQSLLFAHHLVIALPVLAVLRSGAARGRLASVGTALAVAGLAALAVMELLAISAAHVVGDAASLDAGYAIGTVVLGAGLLLLGIAVARAHRWAGWRRALLVVLGVYALVLLGPAAAGPLPVAMTVLAIWSLGFAAVGAALIVERGR